jgi:hypothetical protein
MVVVYQTQEIGNLWRNYMLQKPKEIYLIVDTLLCVMGGPMKILGSRSSKRHAKKLAEKYNRQEMKHAVVISVPVDAELSLDGIQI